MSSANGSATRMNYLWYVRLKTSRNLWGFSQEHRSGISDTIAAVGLNALLVLSRAIHGAVLHVCSSLIHCRLKFVESLLGHTQKTDGAKLKERYFGLSYIRT